MSIKKHLSGIGIVPQALLDGYVRYLRLEKSVTENTLDAYLKSPQWLSDYEADERGELPSDLLRGVLSQDELYNALQAYDEQNG